MSNKKFNYLLGALVIIALVFIVGWLVFVVGWLAFKPTPAVQYPEQDWTPNESVIPTIQFDFEPNDLSDPNVGGGAPGVSDADNAGGGAPQGELLPYIDAGVEGVPTVVPIFEGEAGWID